VVYLGFLIYLFLGVAFVADLFMAAIEVITSKTKTVTVKDDKTGEPHTIEVLFWNATVANLTLMALGSSAPEILLAVIETVRAPPLPLE
jgi:solute carrier family 8 (sodium/calcium exchanger)